MKYILSYFLFFSSLILGQPLGVYKGTEDSETIEVDVEPKKELPGRGQRMPYAPLVCHISRESGVTITGVATTDIISFESYDAGDICLGTFCDEEDFVEMFFSDRFRKIHKVCFETDYAHYTGYVNR